MKFQIQATIDFNVEVDTEQTSIEEISEQMEMSFTVPDGCKMEAVDNQFIILSDE
jgi:hypothetical protein